MVMPSWTPPPSQFHYHHTGWAQRPPTNGLATAAMVVSIIGVAGLCAWGPLSIVVSPVGAILGHMAKRKIRATGESGDGMALTGIILGWVGLGLSILVLAGSIALFWWINTLPPDYFEDPYSY
ncbi:DUF4190 domain-containing protein [Allorhizocola rhizosphaerae]|uniref:DUF4190 domain-containing protein n=1 Tax=Allorhizocola rhizosphaerae TaxID=1872709 RepID=UPI000E3C452D|nr:DUF4190 domain-containing protein [Allorhizocola rhizosphaerae]